MVYFDVYEKMKKSKETKLKIEERAAILICRDSDDDD